MSHILSRRHPHGLLLQCQGCGQSFVAATQPQVHQFASVHAACVHRVRPVDPRYYGMGDAVAAVAKPIARAIGRDPNCLPCQQRQRKLNGWFPRLWKR